MKLSFAMRDHPIRINWLSVNYNINSILRAFIRLLVAVDRDSQSSISKNDVSQSCDAKLTSDVSKGERSDCILAIISDVSSLYIVFDHHYNRTTNFLRYAYPHYCIDLSIILYHIKSSITVLFFLTSIFHFLRFII